MNALSSGASTLTGAVRCRLLLLLLLPLPPPAEHHPSHPAVYITHAHTLIPCMHASMPAAPASPQIPACLSVQKELSL